jgi:hypothetical protein
MPSWRFRTGWLDLRWCFSILVSATGSILSSLLPKGQARGSLVTDAHLAALAIEHGATLCTNDRYFTRFPGLQLDNPMVSSV